MRSKTLISDFLDKYKHYHHYLQHQSQKRIFTIPYSKKHIPSNTPHNRRPGHLMSPIYLTIHSTGNLNSTAENERNWLTNRDNERTASYHLVVDQQEIIECIPLNESAWHAGDGTNGTGNRKTIGLEICESGDRTKTLKNAIILAGKILRDRNWESSKLKRHTDWRSKNCPRILIDNNYRGKPHQTWEWFKKEVRKLL
ncbi:MAG: N-acetylmuramoyl-L-alanine amidase [Desulfobacteraceae bacterium]|nr:N-acetylmuramoyl-L-alanine amidase [Desulfobacteraceae bacterium]